MRFIRCLTFLDLLFVGCWLLCVFFFCAFVSFGLFVVCVVMFVRCCYCLLFVGRVRGLLFVVCCLLFVVCFRCSFLLFVVCCCRLFVCCFSVLDVCGLCLFLWLVVRLLLLVVW